MSLGETIIAHRQAGERVDAAARAVDAAKAFVRKLEAEIESFAGVELPVAESRAAAVKASMIAGATPSFGLSVELQSAVSAKVECEATLAAARQAAAALAGEHSQALTIERDVAQHVQALARGVIVDELSALAAEVRELEGRATALRCALHGAARVFDGGLVARPARFALPKIAVEVIGQRSPSEEIGATNSPAQKAMIAKGERWTAYLRELATDASVVF
jgi:hypothetical protein